MIGGALDKVAGYLDKRFVLTALLPGLVFWVAVLGLTVWLLAGLRLTRPRE